MSDKLRNVRRTITLNTPQYSGFNLGGSTISGLQFKAVDSPYIQSPIQGLNTSQMEPIEFAQKPLTLGQKIGNFTKSPMGGAVIGGALEALSSSQIGGYKRGVLDAADPLYHLAGNNKSAVGEIVSDAGAGIFKASASTGFLPGMAVGGIVKGIGSGINALFGTGVDQEKLDRVNAGTNALKSFNSAATSTDAVNGPAAQVNVENAYTGGLFRKAWARRRNNKLRQQRNDAQSWAFRSVDNNINNIMGDQISTGLSNYVALGGPIETIDYSTPIGYEELTRKYIRDNVTNQDKGITNMFAGIPNSIFAFGGNTETSKYSIGKIYDVSEEEANQLKSMGYEFIVVD